MSWQIKLSREDVEIKWVLAKTWVEDSILQYRGHTLAFAAVCFLFILTSPFTRPISNNSIETIKVEKALIQKDPNTAQPWDFFHPTWNKSPLLSFFGSDKAIVETLIESPVDTSTFVTDPGGRIEKEFQVSTPMKTAVSFWVDVYARYSSNIRIVHDREDLSIIYGYLDFRPFYRSMSRVAAEVKANQVERQVLKQLKTKLLEAGDVTKTKSMTTDEKNTIKNFLSSKGMGSKEVVAKRVSLIRTQSGQSDMFLQALYRSKNLLPHIEAVFRQNGLPVALARIPFVESSFNAKALSKIGAVGIWQFTRETAREMIHAEEESQWSDPLRQTKSAARLLRMYRNVLPDWGTVVTSYNSGVGRLRRILEKNHFSKMEDIYTLPHDKDGLGFAGRNFYPEFLAANIVEAYKEEIFSHLLTPSDYSLVFRGKGVFATDACEM